MDGFGGRFQWRPSRWLAASLLAIGALGACSVLASGMPPALARSMAPLALGWAAWLAGREARRPPVGVVFLADDEVQVDEVRVEGFALHWRGPLVFARWRDVAGRARRLAWWPDTLPAAARRELRLAAPVEPSARSSGSVAP